MHAESKWGQIQDRNKSGSLFLFIKICMSLFLLVVLYMLKLFFHLN